MSSTGLSPARQRDESILRAPVLSATLIVLLVTVAIVDLVLIVKSVELWSAPFGGGRGYISAAQGFDRTAMIAVIATITTYLFFVWWLAHRSAQLTRLRAVGQEHVPRFVAIMSLLPPLTGFMTLSIVRELWRSGSTPVDFLDHRSWQRTPVEKAVTRWWVAAMAACMACGLWYLDQWGMASGPRIVEEQILRHILISIAAGLIQLVAIILTIPLVLEISNRQLERFRVVQERYEARAPARAGSPYSGISARVPLSAGHCFKVLAIACVFQALFILAAVVFELPVWCHLVSTQAILVAAGITLSRSEGVSLSRLAGLSKPRPPEMKAALLVGMGAFGLAMTQLVPWITARFVLEDREDRFREMLEAMPSLVILFPILAIVVAPLVEEILFRGVLFEALSSALPTAVVIVLTAAAFALIHGNLPQMIPTFVLGLHCGLVRALFGSVGAPIVVHLVNNLGALLVLPLVAGKPLPAALIIPSMMLLVLGYGLSMRHWGRESSARAPQPLARAPQPLARTPQPLARAPQPIARAPQPLARVPEPLAASGDTAVADHAGRRMAEAAGSAQLVLRFLGLQFNKGSLTDRWLRVTAARTKRTAGPALRRLRAQDLGGPLAHGLAIALAAIYALRYLEITLHPWPQPRSLTLAITAFFGFWAWGMWRERKALSVICLVIFVVWMMLRDFGAGSFLAVPLFVLGTVAIFREYHVRSIFESLVTLGTGWLGGHGSSGSEHVGLRNGVLFTEWYLERDSSGNDVESEVFHVLMVVPDLHRDGGGPHSSTSGETPELSTFQASFQLAGGGAIEFELEVEERRWLKAAGQDFDLRAGNLIVCVLSEAEAPQLTQLPESLPERRDAAKRLKAFQDQLEPEHPVQTVALYESE